MLDVSQFNNSNNSNTKQVDFAVFVPIKIFIFPVICF